jgi:hypothetical protein
MGIVQIATLLTVAGVAAYVLGFIGVAWSIRFTVADKWSTAWYAVSLMPRTVVAGEGLWVFRRGWLRFPILVVFSGLFFGYGINYSGHPYAWPFVGTFVGIAIWAISSFRDESAREAADKLRREVDAEVELAAKEGGDESSEANWLRPAADENDSSKRSDQEPQGPSRIARNLCWIIGIAGSIIAALFFFAELHLAGVKLVFGSDPYIGLRRNDPVDWDTITGALAIFLVSAFFIAIPLAGHVKRPLPIVTLIGAGESTSRKGQNYMVGWLVAHADGYWHLFDYRHVLVSVPDERVAGARVGVLPKRRAKS